jgi:phage terminase small subunit
MGAIVTEQDIDYLRSLYPHTDFDYISGQEEQLILHFFRGFPAVAAARAAGYKEPAMASKFLQLESTEKLLAYLREREFANINVTRDMLNSMLLQAHSKAGTATEEVMAIRELGKLNDLYQDTKGNRQNNSTLVTINQTLNPRDGRPEVTQRQIQGLPDDELLRLAGAGYDFDLPEPIDMEEEKVIDAEWSEIGAERVMNERA